MAYREVSRMEYEEVVRRWQAGESQRAIARALGLARNTVAAYIRAASVEPVAAGEKKPMLRRQPGPALEQPDPAVARLAPRPTRGFLEYSQARAFLVDPARVARPQDKPKVERHIHSVQERFWPGGGQPRVGRGRTLTPEAYALPENRTWFPTRGGKTEAYLALSAYTLASGRLQGAVAGHSGEASVAIIMRYTLRLLTLQQFQRRPRWSLLARSSAGHRSSAATSARDGSGSASVSGLVSGCRIRQRCN